MTFDEIAKSVGIAPDTARRVVLLRADHKGYFEFAPPPDEVVSFPDFLPEDAPAGWTFNEIEFFKPYFDRLAAGHPDETATEIERIAGELMHNPIIEGFREGLRKEGREITLEMCLRIDQRIRHSSFKDMQRGIDLSDILRPPVVGESVGARRPKTTLWALDRVNAEGWAKSDIPEIFIVPIRTGRHGQPPEVLFGVVRWDEIEGFSYGERRLTRYDRRVYFAIGALYDAGNRIVTLNQIYYAMGRKGRPGKGNREKICASIVKMLACAVTLDNSAEIEAGWNYPARDTVGQLLSGKLERDRDRVNGQITDATLHIHAEPLLIEFAKERKQFVTLPLEVLQTPLSLTDENIAIEDYLIFRIAEARRGKLSEKVLLEAVCANAGITGGKQRQRLPGKLEKLLTHYQRCNLISGYSIHADSVTLSFDGLTENRTNVLEKIEHTRT